jgi:hypothetical protein
VGEAEPEEVVPAGGVDVELGGGVLVVVDGGGVVLPDPVVLDGGLEPVEFVGGGTGAPVVLVPGGGGLAAMDGGGRAAALPWPSVQVYLAVTRQPAGCMGPTLPVMSVVLEPLIWVVPTVPSITSTEVSNTVIRNGLEDTTCPSGVMVRCSPTTAPFTRSCA